LSSPFFVVVKGQKIKTSKEAKSKIMTNFVELLERKYGSIRGAQSKLADDLGVNQSSVSNWLRGRNYPNPDVIKKMAKLLSVKENDLWAIFNPYGNDEKKKKQIESLREVEAIPLTPSNTIQLPILADVPAGLPEFSDRDVEMFVDIPRFLFPGADFIVRCVGDSLEPKIHRGDFCVIRKMQEPIDGRAMLVKTENGVCMKVIKKIKEIVELCSTNPKYKPFTAKELTIIGLIIGHWSRDDRENW
jgi:repressor LexA